MYLPVDLAFTIATTAKADLLLNGATNVVVTNAGGNGALKAITDAGFTLAQMGIKIPTASDLTVEAYDLQANGACTIQLGVINAAGTFTPLMTHVLVATSGFQISKVSAPQGGFKVPLLLAATAYRFALQVSDSGATVRVTGGIDLYLNDR